MSGVELHLHIFITTNSWIIATVEDRGNILSFRAIRSLVVIFLKVMSLPGWNAVINEIERNNRDSNKSKRMMRWL